MENIRTIYVVRNNETHRHTYYTKECAPINAKPLLYSQSKTLKVHQLDGSVQIAYVYGEKTYTYSSVELEQYREEQRVLRESSRERKAMLGAIMAQYECMTNDELKAVLSTMM